MKNGAFDIDIVRKILNNLSYATDLEMYKQRLFDEIESNNVVVLNNQFFYITDIRVFNNDYVHKNLKYVLGYEPDFFLSMDNVYSVIHPDDHDFVLAFSQKSICYSREHGNKPNLLKDPFKNSFSIDFRMKKADGKYIRVNRMTSCAKTDREGNMVYAISIFTDIDHLKKSDNISYSWSGDDFGLFSVDDLIKEYPTSIFSKREIEVLRCLSEGLNCREIADKMYISEHTVVSHRKNMLRKAQVKNSVRLVHYAISKGII